jgi:peptide/nickel transport system ATP-binding protein
MQSILVPEEGMRCNALGAIPGTPPNLKNPPAGCRFAERCKYVVPQCRGNAVALTSVGEQRAYRCIHSEAFLKAAYAAEADGGAAADSPGKPQNRQEAQR